MAYIENLGLFLDVTGPENGHFAHFLAQVNWPSNDARDEFIQAMSNPWTG